MQPRKRNSHHRFRYSLDYKKKVLQSIHSIGMSKTCRKMDVKKEQVQYWLTKEQDILNASPEDCTQRFRLSKTMYKEVAQEEQEIYDWIMEKKRHKEVVKNDEILERASILFIGVPNSKTKATRKWLVSFKKRYGLMRQERERRDPEEPKTETVEVKSEVGVKCEVGREEEVIDVDEMVIL